MSYCQINKEVTKFDMSQGQGFSPWRSASVPNVGGGGLVDYSNSSDTDDDEISLRFKKEAEDVNAPPEMDIVFHLILFLRSRS